MCWMTTTILCDFLIPHRNTKRFCLYRKIICIKETYVFHVIAFNPKFISRNKPRSINIYVNSAFQPLLQFRCKTKEKRSQSHFVLPSPSEGFLPALQSTQDWRYWHNANTAFRLTQKILWDNLSISWSYSLKQLYTGANVTHPGSESLDTGSISPLISFKILPNHSFLKSITETDPKSTKMNGILSI